MLKVCRNGLHEYDTEQNPPWLKSCPECYAVAHRRAVRKTTLTGYDAALHKRHYEEQRPSRMQSIRNWQQSARGKARMAASSMMSKKYGLSLRAVERDGLLDLYPDVKRILETA